MKGWVHTISHRENKPLSCSKGKLKLTWSSHQTGLQRPWFSRGSRTRPFHGDPVLGVGARNGFGGFLLALQPLLDGLGVRGQVGQLVKDIPLADNSIDQIGVPWEAQQQKRSKAQRALPTQHNLLRTQSMTAPTHKGSDIGKKEQSSISSYLLLSSTENSVKSFLGWKADKKWLGEGYSNSWEEKG